MPSQRTPADSDCSPSPHSADCCDGRAAPTARRAAILFAHSHESHPLTAAFSVSAIPISGVVGRIPDELQRHSSEIERAESRAVSLLSLQLLRPASVVQKSTTSKSNPRLLRSCADLSHTTLSTTALADCVFGRAARHQSSGQTDRARMRSAETSCRPATTNREMCIHTSRH